MLSSARVLRADLSLLVGETNSSLRKKAQETGRSRAKVLFDKVDAERNSIQKSLDGNPSQENFKLKRKQGRPRYSLQGFDGDRRDLSRLYDQPMEDAMEEEIQDERAKLAASRMRLEEKKRVSSSKVLPTLGDFLNGSVSATGSSLPSSKSKVSNTAGQKQNIIPKDKGSNASYDQSGVMEADMRYFSKQNIAAPPPAEAFPTPKLASTKAIFATRLRSSTSTPSKSTSSSIHSRKTESIGSIIASLPEHIEDLTIDERVKCLETIGDSYSRLRRDSKIDKSRGELTQSADASIAQNRKILVALHKNPDFIRLTKSISLPRILDSYSHDNKTAVSLLVSFLLSTGKLEFTPKRPANFTEALLENIVERAQDLPVSNLVKLLFNLSDGPNLTISTSMLLQHNAAVNTDNQVNSEETNHSEELATEGTPQTVLEILLDQLRVSLPEYCLQESNHTDSQKSEVMVLLKVLSRLRVKDDDMMELIGMKICQFLLSGLKNLSNTESKNLRPLFSAGDITQIVSTFHSLGVLSPRLSSLCVQYIKELTLFYGRRKQQGKVLLFVETTQQLIDCTLAMGSLSEIL